jgi:hypothetical protein
MHDENDDLVIRVVSAILFNLIFKREAHAKVGYVVEGNNLFQLFFE